METNSHFLGEAGNVSDATQAQALLHSDNAGASGGAGYQNVFSIFAVSRFQRQAL